jgi:hypothetical protein
VLALSLAACQKGSSGLSVSTRNVADAPAAPAAGVSATSLDLGNGVVIERVRIVVREVEVEGGDAGICAGDDSGHHRGSDDSGSAGQVAAAHDGEDHGGEGHGGDDGEDCDDDLEFGPFLVDLSGDDLTGGGVQWAFEVPVPAGTYDEIEVKVHTVPAEKAGSDAGLLEMADLHASIAIDGTIDGEPFRFTAPMEIEQEREGTFVFDDTTSPALTLDFDPSGWFGGSAEARLDPRDPTANGAIRANIRASIRLERDDDHDGCDDDGGDDCGDDHGRGRGRDGGGDDSGRMP